MEIPNSLLQWDPQPVAGSLGCLTIWHTRFDSYHEAIVEQGLSTRQTGLTKARIADRDGGGVSPTKAGPRPEPFPSFGAVSVAATERTPEPDGPRTRVITRHPTRTQMAREPMELARLRVSRSRLWVGRKSRISNRVVRSRSPRSECRSPIA